VTAIIIYIASRRHIERMEAIRRGFNTIPQPGKGGFPLFLGLAGLAIGLALIISATMVQRHYDPDMLTGGVIIFFGGIGFLAYWKMTAQDRERAFRVYEDSLAERNRRKAIQDGDNSQNDDVKISE
ncbi:MAG: hypothetical protein JXB48_18205, partial [Candidatus Latescibacteria bacterium]|nr:hypothetical protein [Candidatus Latescibacterota bacterium]